MNIIVTNSKVCYNGFLKVSTIKEVVETRGTIDFLVYHKSSESSEDIVLRFNEIKDRVGKIIYISNSRNVDLVVKMLVLGIGGHYFDDEFFLDSSSELSNLVNSLDEVTEIAEMGGVSVLSDFLNRYLKNGSTSFSSRYLVSVKEAVQVLMEEYSRKNLEVLQMSETATELFSSTAEVLMDMKKEHGELRKSVSKLESEINKGLITSAGKSDERKMPSLMFFPQISYMKERKIIKIKEIGNVKFLFSFLLGFRIYLETVKNVRPKLIVIESLGDLIEFHYSDWNWITQNKIKDKKLYYNSVVFTNCPNKEVLYGLLDDSDFDTFIVVDRSKGIKNHILNSKGLLYYAIGSESCIKKYSLSAKMCFSSGVNIKGTMFNIPIYQDYPKEKSYRERYYITNMLDCYNMLY